MFNIQSYQKANSVQEAIDLLKADPGARLMSGGTDVLVKLHKGKPGYDRLVDIHGLAELDFVTLAGNGDLSIGPGCCFTRVLEAEPVRTRIPILADALAAIGGPQVRNMGTIGGNLCNGVPSADSATPLLALNAVLTLQGPEGATRMPLREFFLGPGKVALKHGQVLTAITITRDNYADLSGHFHKYAMRDAMDIATINCSAVVRRNGGCLGELRLAFGVAAPVPIRCDQTEQRAAGRTIDAALLDRIAADVLSDVQPRTSWRAAKAFRLQIIATLARRVVREAIIKSGGRLP